MPTHVDIGIHCMLPWQSFRTCSALQCTTPHNGHQHCLLPDLQVAAHGNSWKQLYFERHLQDVLESWDPVSGDLMQLRRLMAFSRRFVQSLHIRQLPSHLDLQLLFECMVK